MLGLFDLVAQSAASKNLSGFDEQEGEGEVFHGSIQDRLKEQIRDVHRQTASACVAVTDVQRPGR